GMSGVRHSATASCSGSRPGCSSPGSAAAWRSGCSPVARVLVNDLSVDFPIYHGNSRSLKRTVFAAASGRLQTDAKHRVVVNALRDISLTLHSGDRLGLIGSN